MTNWFAGHHTNGDDLPHRRWRSRLLIYRSHIYDEAQRGLTPVSVEHMLMSRVFCVGSYQEAIRPSSHILGDDLSIGGCLCQ